MQRPSDIVFWNCSGGDAAHGTYPYSSCASTLGRSFVLLFRFAFLGGALGQVLPQFLCKRRFDGSCGRAPPLIEWLISCQAIRQSGNKAALSYQEKLPIRKNHPIRKISLSGSCCGRIIQKNLLHGSISRHPDSANYPRPRQQTFPDSTNSPDRKFCPIGPLVPIACSR